MKRLLAGMCFRAALRLMGCKTHEDRMTFCLAWVMAIKVVHDEPEVREALKKDVNFQKVFDFRRKAEEQQRILNEAEKTR